MTSRSEANRTSKAGSCRLRLRPHGDLAFDAVSNLWRRRQSEGMKKKDIAEALGRDPAWVSRSLSGPGNWTLTTFGELTPRLAESPKS